MLAEIGGPCCHLRPRCRHNAYVTLGNAQRLRRLNWSKGGLLDAVFVLFNSKNYVLAVCEVFISPAAYQSSSPKCKLDHVALMSEVILDLNVKSLKFAEGNDYS